MHCSPPVHAAPQTPQSFAFVVRSTHAPAQSVSAGPASVAHDSAQTPRRHTSPAPHAAPHRPQFFGSVNVSTHAPLQTVVAPAGHTAPSGKTTPIGPSVEPSRGGLASSGSAVLEVLADPVPAVLEAVTDVAPVLPVDTAAPSVSEPSRLDRPQPMASRKMKKRTHCATASAVDFRARAPSWFLIPARVVPRAPERASDRR